jgi:hypothetical protein
MRGLIAGFMLAFAATTAQAQGIQLFGAGGAITRSDADTRYARRDTTATQYISADSLGLAGTTRVKGVRSNTAALDFASIAAAAEAELSVTVTGAAAGDLANCSPSGSLEANLAIAACYAGTNVVTVRLRNLNTVGSIDPASRTWRATAIRF